MTKRMLHLKNQVGTIILAIRLIHLFGKETENHYDNEFYSAGEEVLSELPDVFDTMDTLHTDKICQTLPGEDIIISCSLEVPVSNELEYVARLFYFDDKQFLPPTNTWKLRANNCCRRLN